MLPRDNPNLQLLIGSEMAANYVGTHRRIMVSRQEPAYTLPAKFAASSVQDQFVFLCRMTSANVAVYGNLATWTRQPAESSSTLVRRLHERVGKPTRCMPPFAAVVDSSGWRALQHPQRLWRSRANGSAHAPRFLGPDVPRHPNNGQFDSLFSCFLGSGGLQVEVKGLERAPCEDRPRLRAAARFVARQDLLFISQAGASFDGHETAVNDATFCFELFSAHRLTPEVMVEAPAAVQLGWMRSLTDATLAIYVPLLENKGEEPLMFVKTFERLGPPHPTLKKFAVAQTERGWMPLQFDWPAQRYTGNLFAFSDAFDVAPEVVGSKQLLANAKTYYFASLLDAYLLGGGVTFVLPDPTQVPEPDEGSEPAAEISEEAALEQFTQLMLRQQVEQFASRYAACAQVQTADHAKAWAESMRVVEPWWPRTKRIHDDYLNNTPVEVHDLAEADAYPAADLLGVQRRADKGKTDYGALYTDLLATNMPFGLAFEGIDYAGDDFKVSLVHRSELQQSASDLPAHLGNFSLDGLPDDERDTATPQGVSR